MSEQNLDSDFQKKSSLPVDIMKLLMVLALILLAGAISHYWQDVIICLGASVGMFSRRTIWFQSQAGISVPAGYSAAVLLAGAHVLVPVEFGRCHCSSGQPVGFNWPLYRDCSSGPVRGGSQYCFRSD